MELVQIISSVLIYGGLLLVVVIIASYVLSKIRNSQDSAEDGQDLVGNRVKQITYLKQRPEVRREPVPVIVRNSQVKYPKQSRPTPPKIRVIRRVDETKHQNAKTSKSTKNINTRFTSTNNKQRYTILNEESQSALKHENMRNTGIDYLPEERIANFR